MSETKKRVEQIIKHLEEDVAISENLFKAIEKQYSMISLADSDGLTSVNHEIESLAEKLRVHTNIRSENLRFIGFEPNEKGLDKLASKLPKKIRDRVFSCKRNLEANIVSCKSANEKSANQLILSKEMLSKITGGSEQGYLE